MMQPVDPARRRLLKLAAAGLLTGTAAVAGADRLHWGPNGAGTAEAPHRPPAGVDAPGSILVMVQLAGGLDFLDTVVPVADNRYRTLRGPEALAASDLLPLDDTMALHGALPNLEAAWRAGQLAIVHGIGLPDPSLSHFVDTEIWERGRHEVGDGSGWLGRALDALTDHVDPLIGVSIGGLSPAMRGPRGNTVAVPDDGYLPWTDEFKADYPGLVAAHRRLLDFPDEPGTLARQVRESQQLARAVAETVGGALDVERLSAMAELSDDDEGDEDGGRAGLLGARLSIVADLINSGLSTRAYHVRHGDFDTHADQGERLPWLLAQLDAAIAAFQERLGPNADRVIVATWSEFGRRPEWNGTGTDHGTAGTQLVVGPRVRGGHHGEPAPLDRFDDDGNFLVTGDFRGYLGGLVEGVLDVEAGRTLPGGPRPLELVA